MLQPLRGLRTPHRPIVSSPLAAAAALWLPCVRGAVRRRAGLRGCLRVRGKGKGRRPSPVSAPNRLFELLRCFARLIRQAETLRLQPLRDLHRSTLCFFFQNARPPGSLRSPSEPRTTLPFLCAFLQNARPPGSLRSPSVSAPKPSFRRFRCSAWLILRFRTIAHTGAGVSLGLFGKPKRSSFSRIRGLHRSALCFFFQNAHASAASRPPNPAPSSRFFSISRRSGLRGCRHRAESTHHLTPSGCVPSGGAVAPPAPPLPPPSRCRPDRFKGSP